jgi:hypothetical protein
MTHKEAWAELKIMLEAAEKDLLTKSLEQDRAHKMNHASLESARADLLYGKASGARLAMEYMSQIEASLDDR